MKNEHLDITPTVGMLALLKNLDYNEWYALGEFVDNAIQSYRQNKKVLKKLDPLFKLKIKIDISSSEIHIKDNAAGIGHDRYAAAFETGRPPPDTDGLSEFGIGMKIAACWFADRWKVHTKAIGETAWRLVEFDIMKIRDNNIKTLEVTLSAAKLNAHYTHVTLSKLNHKPKINTVKKIKEYLGAMYRHLVNSNEIDIIVDNKSLRYEMPTIRTSTYYKDWEDGLVKKPKKYKWYKELNFVFDDMPMKGFVAMRETGRVKQAGFALFRRGRLILGTEENPFKPAEIFGQGNDRRFQVIFGELHMDDMPVAFSKNGFRWDDGTKNRFILELHKNVQFFDKHKKIDFLKQCGNWSENLERNKVREDTKSSLDQISNVIARGIENTQSTKIKIEERNKKHKKTEESDETEWQETSVENIKYKYKIVTEYNDGDPNLYDCEYPDSKNEFKIKIYVNLKHKFAERFFTHANDRIGFLTFIAFCAICEAQIRNIEKVKDASLFRYRLNAICENLPPRS